VSKSQSVAPPGLPTHINKTHPIDTDKPPLSYPIDELGTFIGNVQDNDYHASLRVDLRPYPGGVKFDLYGYIRRYQDGTKSGPNTTATKRAGQKAQQRQPLGTGAYTTDERRAAALVLDRRHLRPHDQHHRLVQQHDARQLQPRLP
jgi:hypothetical protein